MAKKFITKTHLTDAEGNLVAPGTEIEESLLGDADVIARYKSLEAVDASEKTGEKLDDSFEELNRHSRAELVETASAKGIEVGEKETKADIIAKILA